MNSNYKSLTEQMQRRLNPENLAFKEPFREELRSLQYQDALLFIRFAMKGVEPEYTSKSIEAGNRAKKHLEAELMSVDYRFQGSVMTNTHIRGYSDIDLLCLSSKFYNWDSYNVDRYLNEDSFRQQLTELQIRRLDAEKNKSSYQGDSNNDLRTIRLTSERIMTSKYTECDTSKPKSIKIRNKDLHRDVDIVTAAWYNDLRTILRDDRENRGVKVYDKDANATGSADFPFISILRINQRSSNTNGRLKKMIRFLKNVKSFSDLEINLSSFDINALCFDIDTSDYWSATYIELVTVLHRQLTRIVNDSAHADSIVSVDEREYIFRGKPQKVDGIRRLLGEVSQVLRDMPKPLYS